MNAVPRALWVMLFALLVVVGGVAMLAGMHVAPPPQPYEKQLDLRATASTMAPTAPADASQSAPAPATTPPVTPPPTPATTPPAAAPAE